MSTSNDGGPAFPVTPTDRSGQIAETQCGMTLRDWFAGQALAATRHSYGNSYTALAKAAYAIADAMLAARNQEPQP